MKRTATVLLWLVIVFEVLYTVASAVILLVSCCSWEGERMLGMGGMGWAPIIYQAICVLIPGFVKVITAIILLILSALKGKKIFFEVLVIVLFSGIAVILAVPMDIIYFSVTERLRYSIMVVEVMQRITAGMGYISVLNVIPTTLLPVAAAFCIAHKKFVKQ